MERPLITHLLGTWVDYHDSFQLILPSNLSSVTSWKQNRNISFPLLFCGILTYRFYPFYLIYSFRFLFKMTFISNRPAFQILLMKPSRYKLEKVFFKINSKVTEMSFLSGLSKAIIFPLFHTDIWGTLYQLYNLRISVACRRRQPGSPCFPALFIYEQVNSLPMK